MATNYETGDQPGKELKDQLKQDIGSKAREASRQLADKGKEKAEALSSKAADTLDDVEAAADAEADALENLGWGNLSEYIREMADGIGGLSENLRHKSVDELIRGASELAHRNTGLFLLGSVAIGFGLSRFAKAGAGARDSENQHNSAERYQRGPYGYQAEEARTTDPWSGSDGYRPYESH